MNANRPGAGDTRSKSMRDTARAALDAASGVAAAAVTAADKTLERLPERRRRTVILAAGGVALALILVISAVIAVRVAAAAEAERRDLMALGPWIPAEEVFLPAEPDYLPGVLLDRSPRGAWTADDARPYWRDPRRREGWRDEVGAAAAAAVDDLLERVP